jgi:hypothetical protein
MSDETVTIDGLLADLDEQIGEAMQEVDLVALMRLVDLQGQKRGMLRVVAFSREQVARQVVARVPAENGVERMHLGPPLEA